MSKQRALLIHSGGFTSRQWRRLSEALAPDFDVLAPDLLGYGEAGPWPNGVPFHFRQDLELLETLLGNEPVHLVGHSYGGFLALQLALRHPERVRSIAAYEPVAFGILDEMEDADAWSQLVLVRTEWQPNENGVDEEWLRGFIEWWNGAGAWDRLGEETRGAFRTMGWKVFQEVMSLAADRTDRATYGSIAAPTLILGGALSPLAERRVVEKLGAALPHAKAQFLAGVGHMGPISHALLVNEAIAAHLRNAARQPVFDRSAHERSSPPRENARCVVFDSDRFGIDGDCLATIAGNGELFLGRLDGAPLFLAEGQTETMLDFRAAAAALCAEHVLLLSFAKGMLEWTRRTRFCSACGNALDVRQGGHVRFCTSCETEVYPRTDPAVMMMVTHRDRLLLAQHKGRATKFWSTLAGFVEPGESLEDAVRRELFEETGLVARELRYFGSQPWPLPASLMIGFTIEVENDAITIDENELADARWFSREEIDDSTLSSRISLSRWMIESWRSVRAN